MGHSRRRRLEPTGRAVRDDPCRACVLYDDLAALALLAAAVGDLNGWNSAFADRLCAVARQHAGNGPRNAPSIEGMARRWLARRRAYDAQSRAGAWPSDGEADRAYERLARATDALAALPARSLRDLAAKVAVTHQDDAPPRHLVASIKRDACAILGM